MSYATDQEIYELLHSQRRTKTIGRVAFRIVAAFVAILFVCLVSAATVVLMDDSGSARGVMDVGQ